MTAIMFGVLAAAIVATGLGVGLVMLIIRSPDSIEPWLMR